MIKKLLKKLFCKHVTKAVLKKPKGSTKQQMPTKGMYWRNFFPELKESEDERIRKEILGLVRYTKGRRIGYEPRITQDKMIAWLKKQETSYTKKDINDAYLKGITDAKNEIEKQHEANYQIRKDIATFIFNYRGDIKDRAKWMNYLGIKISFVEKQDNQKSQGKSALEAWKDMRLEVYAQASGNKHGPNDSDDTTKMFSLNDIDEIFEKIAETCEDYR